MTDWVEIAVTAPVAVADDLAALLADHVEAARTGAEIRAGEVVFWVALADAERALADTRAAVGRLAEAGLPVDPAGVSMRAAVPEAEWRDAWKRYFFVTRLTRQVVIVPSWERYEPAGDDLVIHLDPGQAFGTGAHASTRLVLEALQRLRDGGAAGARILDVGTGSGILAIAAARLWPDGRALAVDNDPIAVDCARDNAAANGLADRITCAGTPVGEVPGAFDLVCANIQANILTELRDAIAARVAPGGHLVLAGLLSGQAAEVAARYAAAGLEVEAVTPSEHDPAWSAAHLRRDRPAP
jgi:ribosomal protein L11 methyltransferase